MPEKSKKNSTNAIAIVILIGLAILAVRNGWIPWNEVRNETISPIYDTDPANDNFIKGDLKIAQLKILDRILAREQKNDEMRLSNELVKELSNNDKDVIEAYAKWRKCYDLMRSRHHVVYPNQRANLSAPQ